MTDLKKYFQSEESYNTFIQGISDQLANITFGNRAKIEAKKPPFLGASVPIHVIGQKGSKLGSYWLKIEKMDKVTLD